MVLDGVTTSTTFSLIPTSLEICGRFRHSHPSFTKLFQSISVSVLHVSKMSVVTGQGSFSDCAATSLWAVCKDSEFAASLLLAVSFPLPKVPVDTTCVPPAWSRLSGAPEVQGAPSFFSGLPLPVQRVLYLWRKKFVHQETARLCSRSVMTNFPGIRDLNWCWFSLWYSLSLKRKGVRDFKCLLFFFSTWTVSPSL